MTALRVGQKVQLTGTVTGSEGNGARVYVGIDCDWRPCDIRAFPPAALTPVVEPEPAWTSGDVVRVGGRAPAGHIAVFGVDGLWRCSCGATHSPQSISVDWSNGDVQVLHKEPSDG